MIWLSSFPRSGNTFLRNILFEVYGLESSTFHRESTYPMDNNIRSYPFVKTHELPSSLVEFEPGIPVVYLIRDGRDVVCSLAHHRTDLISPGSDYTQNLIEAITAEKGSFFGGWSKNVSEWLERADLVIRYEDLIRDPIFQVERLREVYELPEAKIEKLPTFETQKLGLPKYGSGRDRDISELEKKEQASKFFRKGIVGGWKKDMPEHLQDLFWSYHGDTMEKCGYSFSGELTQPHPGFDSALRSKLGLGQNARQHKKYRVLIESEKLVSDDNDGVKRYQVELLKALFPVVENPDSNWEIDLYIHGEITPLLDCKEIIFHDFISSSAPEGGKVQGSDKIQKPNKLIIVEQKLVALVPRQLVGYLAKYNITIFHAVYEFLRRMPTRFIESLSFPDLRKAFKKIQTSYKTQGDKFSDYDLVHIPLQQNYAPFRKIQNKILITIHDLSHLHFPDFHTIENISNANRGMRFAIKKNAELIAISKSTKKDILNHTSVALNNVHLIYEAADRMKFNFKNNREEGRRVREKYGLDFKEPYIICLSTLEPRKNLENTVKSYILLRQDNPGIALKLVIAGKKGWMTRGIYRSAEEYNDYIFFTGFVEDTDLAYLYSGALMMSYLSFYEGFGLPPLEAMCCGTPVIYGNNSSLIEVVGEGGLPADPSDVNDIKAQYERMFYEAGLRDHKSDVALRQSLRFSWRKTAIKTLNLYKKVIENNV